MTYIYKIVNTTDLFHDLKAMGRDNFSYDGAKALMEWLEQYAEDCGEAVEYDPIALCCAFAEYSESEYEDLAAQYDAAPQRADFEGESEFFEELKEWLNEQTTVINFDDGLIIQSF